MVLSLATGEYIALLTDDDQMLPENLARKVAVLSAHPPVGLVHSKYHVIDESGQTTRCDTNWAHGPDRVCDAIEPGGDVLTQLLLTYNRINLPTVMFRRECYDRLGGFSDRLTLVDDYEFWMRIAAHYDVAFLAQPLAKWRYHSQSRTLQYASSAGGLLTDAAFRETLLAKRLILRRHVHASSGLQEQAWERLASNIAEHAEDMLSRGAPPSAARSFLVTMCGVAPETLCFLAVWKTLLKTMLPRQILCQPK